jgi:hypothetical protein
MFDITPEDIANLNDENLRAVIARLCEAELRRRGCSVSGVTWGGNQTAPDGGIDVRVDISPANVMDGYIPRPATAFQVKKPDMPRAEIIAEMRPKGNIRPSIQELADKGGAYIIVSSDGSTADTALQDRRNAMREALKDIPNADALATDFYDRTRIATWLRTHEGLIPWARSLVGRSIPGWRSYGPWAHVPGALTATYLLDDKLRIHNRKQQAEQGLSPLAGIQEIRDQLRNPQCIVRLVGLSGVGKTRLVQALFEDQVGTNSLDPSLAIYTNIADAPDPTPTNLVTNLVAAQTRAILVVDNCPPDLHQRLSEVCRQRNSQVSLITIEYDIREDQPEGTDAYTLDTSSPELITKLVEQRYPMISGVNSRAIATFSGGNARIAIAVAATLGQNETLAGLTDEQLFQRLFLQRHHPDEALYLAAQACALVYSFEGEDVSASEDAELVRLGRLIGKSPLELYRSVAELQRRDLVQQRGVWRAVLPQAIANRLAGIALQNFPYTAINEHLLSCERLKKSFSRRLGYLHKNKEAVRIVKRWLAADGLLGDTANLDGAGLTMFENIAPAAPELFVAALERTLQGPDRVNATKTCKGYLSVLRSIAFDPALFTRCVTLMADVIVAEDDDERAHSTQLFVSLFYLCLSGTHATIEQRLKCVEEFIGSAAAKRRALGLWAFKATLEAWQFTGTASYEFGARSRDYGHLPASDEEAQHWFRATLALVERVACSDHPAAPDVRAALAHQFRGLWHRGGVPAELASVCEAIRRHAFWPAGWLAVRQTLEYDGKGMDPEDLASLNAIEAQLRPTDVTQKVHAIIFSNRMQGLDFEDFEEHPDEDISARVARTEALAQDLGKVVAADESVLTELLPDVVRTDGRLWEFGQGLAEGASDVVTMWDRLVAAFTAAGEGARKPQVFRGFLRQLYAKDPALTNLLLDRSVEHETLAWWYPCLAVAIDVDSDGVARLKRAVAFGRAPAYMYSYLAVGRATDPIPAPDLRELVLAIAHMPNGSYFAAEVLYMRLHADEQQNRGIAPELADAGCALLQEYAFTSNDDREDYGLGKIAASCLTGVKGVAAVTKFCINLKQAVRTHKTHAFYHDDVLGGLFRAQPTAALDALCAGSAEELQLGIRVLRDARKRKDVLTFVPHDELLSWCDKEATTRYPAIASAIVSAQRANEKAPLQWTDVALRLLLHAPDPGAVLQEFVAAFSPSAGWSGSLAAILEAHAPLLDELDKYPQLASAIEEARISLRKEIEFQRQFETRMDRARDERFE